ncbi:TIR domain-containing protein [Prochlorothrix hollandica]|uniref:TIR domain-containing protein n=1 Tax=Prochlorothrix hollandica TaxID=1223 RepID=UPI003341014D
MNPLQDAFISYGRADSRQFAQHLHDRLTDQGYSLWFDFEDIPPGVDYQQQIDQGITAAHNFIYIISPHSVNSPYCTLELELALQLKKRIIPLMHVEEISRETWQARNPEGTDQDWHQYRQAGRHTSLAHLHPALGKINWVNCREGIDDFESSLVTISQTLERQRDYVQQHTQLLVQANHWAQHQKQPSDLLQGEALHQAQQWLGRRFTAEQAPCQPTDRHSEYICTSLSEAQGGATRVFLCHSEQDIDITETLRWSLLREGMPVWTNRANIRTGADFQQEISRGIERADTLVYLLSAHSLASPYCQQELAYGRQLNKRIIPMLMADVPLEQIPQDQRSLQFINNQNFSDPASYAIALDTLLQTLKRHQDYDYWHKTLLVKALHWDQRERPKGLLLRADELAVAEHWIQLQQQQPADHAPDLLPLILTQDDYVAGSREKNKFFDAFISYGRADSKDFAFDLHDRLSQAGYRVWFDQNDIPLGVDFQDQINDGLDKSDNFIYIISPHSVNSPYCAKEIELAVARNKRIIPLLHVEEISHDTWQQRHPQGTPEDWLAYTAAGKHSVFPQMPVSIGKVNWIYFRPGMDDDQASFGGLLALLDRDRDYVHDHTELLCRAMDWQRHQCQTRYLLTGDQLKTAESWLKTQFTDRQPPCLPTSLQCEFICESLKNANNLMTQVFIAYAETDRDLREKIHCSLMREGITVWINRTDLAGGTEFQNQIDRGIEEADNIVVLISPQAVASPHCQQVVAYGYSLKKRIIPLLISSTDLTYIPEDIRALQFIDFSQWENGTSYDIAINKLIKEVQNNAPYHYQHKMLLTQALKWQRQQRNPSILLRGYGLRQMESWYQIAKQNTVYSLVAAQAEFLDESRKQPPHQTFNVFISYSRADADFARKLNENLQIQGMFTWFDQENIDTGKDFQTEIYKGIENSENFLFIISPSSVSSPYASAEIEYASQLNKRFVAVLHREAPPSSLHPAIATVQWIDFRRRGSDFLSNFGELVRFLASDPLYIQNHTRLLVKANEWEQSGRDDGFLLRGKDLSQALQWLQETQKRSPKATALQEAYLTASRRLPHRRLSLKSLVGTTVVATVVVIVARLLGATQGAELRAYDTLMQWRPSEPPDQRLVVVEVDAASTRWLRSQLIAGRYQPGLGTIPDAALADLLDTVARHEPRVLALDFYRDFQAQSVVADRLKTMDNLVMLCKGSTVDEQGLPVEGYSPPPEVPAVAVAQRVGFSDFSEDGEKMIRRHYLLKLPDEQFCPVDQAFSLVLAQRFLVAEGQGYGSPYVEEGGEVYLAKIMTLGPRSLPALWVWGGGYRDMNLLQGYQMMVNFRSSPSLDNSRLPSAPLHFAPRVSFKAVLTGELTAAQLDSLFRDRLVLIGFSDRADPTSDFWSTPLGELPGVYVQGQLASQLISAVLDDRPLIWWWNWGWESLWIGFWASLAAVWVWAVSPLGQRLLGGVALGLGLTALCYGVLVASGGWLPWVPPLLAMGLAGLGVAGLTQRLRNP